jgi:hypothetical protein
MDLEKFFQKNIDCFDRFTFDRIFKRLLIEGYSNEEAKDLILFNCRLSAIIFQERIDNAFYKTIKTDEDISEDLDQMKKEILNSRIRKYRRN